MSQAEKQKGALHTVIFTTFAAAKAEPSLDSEIMATKKKFMRKWLEKLFKDETDSLLIQLFRYGFVGGAAFIVDYGALFLLTDVCGIHYLLSATISFILGLITNYLLSISWVFNNRTMGNRLAEFLVFAVIGVIGLGLNALIMYVCTDKMGIHYMVSKIISTVIVFFWNFFARKIVLFKQNNNHQ